jgi:hypothetical protein
MAKRGPHHGMAAIGAAARFPALPKEARQSHPALRRKASDFRSPLSGPWWGLPAGRCGNTVGFAARDTRRVTGALIKAGLTASEDPNH